MLVTVPTFPAGGRGGRCSAGAALRPRARPALSASASSRLRSERNRARARLI